MRQLRARDGNRNQGLPGGRVRVRTRNGETMEEKECGMRLRDQRHREVEVNMEQKAAVRLQEVSGGQDKMDRLSMVPGRRASSSTPLGTMSTCNLLVERFQVADREPEALRRGRRQRATFI